MCDSPTVFLCYITTRCQLQRKCCRVHLEAARGNRSHTRFDWHVLTSPNEPNFEADSHAVNQGPTACTSLLPFTSIPVSSPPSLVSLPVCLGPPPPPASLCISAHCPARKRAGRGRQLNHGAFYLECPQPSVYQWNQPGI